MDLEQRLRASLVAPDPGTLFTARVMARVRRGALRRRTGFVLLGVAVAAGAAAAMLALRTVDVQSLPAGVTSMPPAADSKPAPGDRIAQLVPEPAVPLPGAEPVPEVAPGQLSPRYSVLMMPLRHVAQDRAGGGAVAALYASMIDELRKVPALTLHVQGDSEQGSAIQHDYVLTLTSLAAGTSQSGGVVVRATDGDKAYVVGGGNATTVLSGGTGAGGAVFSGTEVNSPTASGGTTRFTGSAAPGDVQWVELTVAPRQSAAFRFIVPVGVEGASRPQQCNNPDGALLAECSSPAQLAAAQVEDLRLGVFPPDPAFQQRVVARLGELHPDECNDCRDFSVGERKALQTLQRLSGEGGSRLDAGTIQAIARYAASQPARMRANIWSTLRWAKVAHPALAAPLVETLRSDTDQQVRLVALAYLEASYSSDPLVRNTLETVGRDDLDAAVGLAAKRVLHGQAQWRDEIVTALNEVDQPYEARLAPLLATGLAVSPLQQAHRRAVLQEQQVLLPLTTLLHEQRRQSAQSQATSVVLGLLASIEDPLVFDLFMQLVRDGHLERETVVRRNSVSMSGPVSSWIFGHRDDPRVLKLLSEVDPQLLARMQQSRPMTGTAVQLPPELAGPPSGLLERIREVTGEAAPSAPPAH